MEKNIRVWIVGLVLTTVALSGCTFAGADEGQLTLVARGEGSEDVESLFVSFSEVAVRRSSGDGGDPQMGMVSYGALQGPDNGTDDNTTDDNTTDDNTTDDPPTGNETDDNATGNQTGGQVTICHVPPGNEENAHTLTVDENAVDAHMAHGDSMGACVDDGNDTAEQVDTGDDDYIIVIDQTIEIDLMARTDTVNIAERVDVEVGDFDQIVLRVESARAVLTDGTEVEVNIDTNIVIIDRSFRIVEDDVTRVEVDFDLGQGLQRRDAAADPDPTFPPGDGDDGDVTVNVQFSLTLIVTNVIIVEGQPDPTGGTGDDGTGGDGGDGDDGSASQNARVNVLIRGAQSQFEGVESVLVTFDQVTLVLSCPGDDGTGDDGTTGNGTDNGTDDGTGNQTGNQTDGGDGDTIDTSTCETATISVSEGEIDLLDFTAENSFAVLGFDEVDADQLTAIVLRARSATIVETDGDEVEATITQEEAEVRESFDLRTGVTTQFTLVIDLESSLSQTGDGEWTLSPLIVQVDVSETDQPAEEDQPDPNDDLDDGDDFGGSNETDDNQTG